MTWCITDPRQQNFFLRLVIIIQRPKGVFRRTLFFFLTRYNNAPSKMKFPSQKGIDTECSLLLRQAVGDMRVPQLWAPWVKILGLRI